MPGLGISFGRGGATTFQQDLSNADCILIQGSNMAECHPVGFQWVMEAKLRGAKIIHVDPRYTRTSSVADLHVPLRPGSDIAFLGGLVNYVLENGREFRDYVLHYTNAAYVLTEDYKDTEDLGGLFSGWDEETKRYDAKTWRYEGTEDSIPAAGQKHVFPKHETEHVRGTDITKARRDDTLTHPRCVFQVLKKHFARYTPEFVENVTGVPRETFLQVAKTLCDNSGPDRTSAFCYAVGWTHHSVGVQYIRTAAILQLLLGNMGRPGGGIMALRGHASIQGSTDIPTLFNILPGYIPMPHGEHIGFDKFIKVNTAGAGFWSKFDTYAVSLLKAWFGDDAKPENDWGYDWLPVITGDHSHLQTAMDTADGKLEGWLVMGENPTVGSPNAVLMRKALRNLKWLVVRDMALVETADFWRSAPEVLDGSIKSEDIGTEVFLFPAAAHTEKEGTFTNTQRLLQWRNKAVEPPADARSELHFVVHLGRMLKARATAGERDAALRAVTWDYSTHGPHQEPDAEEVLAEINGSDANGKPIGSYTELKADGSTRCGCWIYAGVYKEGVNQAARRKPGREQSIVAPEWGWAWPANRRMLYNRASARPDGKPWSERKKYVWWDEAKQQWTGLDNPDFELHKRPDYVPAVGATGLEAIGGADPFIMQVDGKGWLFAPSGIIDGPMPTHYEPEEGVTQNVLYPNRPRNPTRIEKPRKDNVANGRVNPRYPYILTTYRLTEHHTAGGMSRWLSWLSELQPEMFCEVSPQLAAERGLTHGGWATIMTARGAIEARVLVTERLQPLQIEGKRQHVIGLPYHWSTVGRVRGDGANDLLHIAMDPNVYIQETKALTGNIRPGRRRAKGIPPPGPRDPAQQEQPPYAGLERRRGGRTWAL